MICEELKATVSEFSAATGDSSMNVIRFGRGENILVIVSGVSLTGLEGKGRDIAEAYSVFTEDYTVYLFDRRRKVPEGFGIHDMAEDIYNVLRAQNVEKACLYGVSQGGMIVLDMAISHQEFTEKLVLCSTLAKAGNNPALSEWLHHAEKKNVVELNRSFFKYVYSEAYLDTFRAYLPVLEQAGTEEDCGRFVNILRAIPDFDVSERLCEIKCPVLVISDTNDKVIPVENSYYIAEKLDCEIIVYDKYSHAVFDEAPDIKDRIYQFLKA